jgi:hypothetical protein
MSKYISLCYRCEHRAKFLEMQIRPRYECGEPNRSVSSCYMFQPARPLVIKPRDGDTRPITLNLIGGRVEAVKVAENLEIGIAPHKDGLLPIWQQKNKGE